MSCWSTAPCILPSCSSWSSFTNLSMYMLSISIKLWSGFLWLAWRSGYLGLMGGWIWTEGMEADTFWSFGEGRKIEGFDGDWDLWILPPWLQTSFGIFAVTILGLVETRVWQTLRGFLKHCFLGTGLFAVTGTVSQLWVGMLTHFCPSILTGTGTHFSVGTSSQIFLL